MLNKQLDWIVILKVTKIYTFSRVKMFSLYKVKEAEKKQVCIFFSADLQVLVITEGEVVLPLSDWKLIYLIKFNMKR